MGQKGKIDNIKFFLERKILKDGRFNEKWR